MSSELGICVVWRKEDAHRIYYGQMTLIWDIMPCSLMEPAISFFSRRITVSFKTMGLAY
jgi:hypothetical protein